MTSPSKAKGKGWERECAKILSDIFGYHFERNKNGSGAFVGGSHASRKSYLSNTQLLSFMADILPPDEMTKICVECKFYNMTVESKNNCEALDYPGLYFAGDGAGYTHSLSQAAANGLYIAEDILNHF